MLVFLSNLSGMCCWNMSAMQNKTGRLLDFSDWRTNGVGGRHIQQLPDGHMENIPNWPGKKKHIQQTYYKIHELMSILRLIYFPSSQPVSLQNRTWNLTSAETHIGGTWPSCHVGYQEVARCSTKGGFQGAYITFTFTMKKGCTFWLRNPEETPLLTPK